MGWNNYFDDELNSMGVRLKFFQKGRNEPKNYPLQFVH